MPLADAPDVDLDHDRFDVASGAVERRAWLRRGPGWGCSSSTTGGSVSTVNGNGRTDARFAVAVDLTGRRRVGRRRQRFHGADRPGSAGFDHRGLFPARDCFFGGRAAVDAQRDRAAQRFGGAGEDRRGVAREAAVQRIRDRHASAPRARPGRGHGSQQPPSRISVARSLIVCPPGVAGPTSPPSGSRLERSAGTGARRRCWTPCRAVFLGASGLSGRPRRGIRSSDGRPSAGGRRAAPRSAASIAASAARSASLTASPPSRWALATRSARAVHEARVVLDLLRRSAFARTTPPASRSFSSTCARSSSGEW